MPLLDRKATAVFAGKVVRKDLVCKVKVGANVPVFVLEYPLGKYCATHDPVAIDAGLRVVNNTLSANFVGPNEVNRAQSTVKDKGRHTFIDKVQVRYVSDDDKHWAELKNFSHKYVHIPEHYLRDYDRLLMGGIWAQLDLKHQYDEEAKGKRSPFWIENLKPIQLATFDLEEYRECCRQLTTDEWIDLLLRTIGMEPAHFERRVKLLFLLRLVPLCEQNYNLIELGPRGTGKSYAFQEISPYAILLTGPTTVANLFYNLATSKMGLVGIWDAIAFDEVADLQKMPKGFVVDYLAEALRELRKYNFTEIIDRHFSLGSHLNARDVKAVRKTVSGLVKLLYPHGEISKEELTELAELALEGRRRVKEQLKKMGSFEYHQTSFSLIDNATREERFVGVPEQGGQNMISTDPLAPGSVYTASVDEQGKVGLYRLEVGCSPGTGKLRIAGGIEGSMKESLQRAFAYLLGQKVKMGIAQLLDTTDFHVEAIDLLSNRVPCEAGIALVAAVYSAIKKHSVLAGLVILGDLSIQGNIKSVRSLSEPLQVAMDNGARRALIPLENKRNFLEVSGDIVERVDPVFFSDPMTAATKALGMI